MLFSLLVAFHACGSHLLPSLSLTSTIAQLSRSLAPRRTFSSSSSLRPVSYSPFNRRVYVIVKKKEINWVPYAVVVVIVPFLLWLSQSSNSCAKVRRGVYATYTQRVSKYTTRCRILRNWIWGFLFLAPKHVICLHSQGVCAVCRNCRKLNRIAG